MKPKIIFRADGNRYIGVGHVIRSLALADMLKAEFNCIWAIQQSDEYLASLIRQSASEIISLEAIDNYTSGIDEKYIYEANQFSQKHLSGNEIVVLDGYHFKTSYQQIIKSTGCKVVAIDDLHAWHNVADLIINHAEGVRLENYSAEPYTQFCLGLKFALLRSPFLRKTNAARKINSVKKIFVSMGGADTNNVCGKILMILAQVKKIEAVTVLPGNGNQHINRLEEIIRSTPGKNIQLKFNLAAQELSDELASCQLAVCPGSGTAIEACATGIGIISGHTVSNQLSILNGLKSHHCLIDVGNLVTVNSDSIYFAIMKLINNPSEINEMILHQQKLIDGKSPERLLEYFLKLSK
ncbi:MAG: UDP-2,4-diacetamido-2,4,6-trideoxy-beta-L-altropyranose hydrolase [Bacteroidia bacterium]